MKSGIPWNLKRVDDDTRQAVVEAARRSGMSVADWLNQVLAPGASAQGLQQAAPPKSDFNASMAEIRDRLDEIERGLAGRGAPQVSSQNGVAEMIAGLAREIEASDERARSSVEGLRNAGAPASAPPNPDDNRFADALRELDRQIADMTRRVAPAQNPPPPDAGQHRLDEIRVKLDSLLAHGPEAAAPRRGQPAAAIEAALAALEHRIDDARAGLPPKAPTNEGLARLEAQIADIGARLSSADERRPRKDAELAAAIREIAAHQRTLDDRAETFALRRDQKALASTLDALRSDIAALRQQVHSLGRVGPGSEGALADLAERIDALVAEAPVDRNLIAALRADFDDLRHTVEASTRESGIAALAAGHKALAGQVNALIAGAPNRKQVEALAEEVAALRSMLAADDSPKAIKRLEGRIGELGRALDAMLAAQQDREPGPILEQLEERLREISTKLQDVREPVMPVAVTSAIANAHHRVEARLDDLAARLGGFLAEFPRQAATIATLEERLQTIVERIDGLSLTQYEPSQALDLIQSEVRSLRAELAANRESSSRTDLLEAQIRHLARHLEDVAATAPDAEALLALERQVEALASELHALQPQVAAELEGNVLRLQALLGEATRESIVGARAEAQQAVTQLSELVAEYEIDSDLVRTLMRDLDALKNAAGASDETTHAQLKAVGQTLADVVDRLGRIEREGQHGSGSGAVFSIGAPAEPAPAPKPGGEAGSAPGERAFERRADFIAAARRAAQTAATQAAPSPPAGAAPVPAVEPAVPRPEDDQPAGAFKRLGLALRGRRRPLLLAAAAIVIAIGAIQLFGRIGAGPAEDRAIVQEVVAAPVTEPVGAAEATAHDPIPEVLPPETGALQPTEAEPPPARPTSAIAFAEPEATSSRFATAPSDLPPDGFAPAAPAPAAAVANEAPPEVFYASGLDPRLGDDRLLRAADDGDPAAAFEVARRYADGSRMPKNLAKAVEWYRRAAEGGIAVAQYRLGSLYERGQGTERNRVEAANWYQRAADQGNVNAMHNLAVMLSEGIEGSPDHAKAVQWFLAAANYGVRDSQYNLGVIYARGMGPEQNLVESYKWFAIAAAQGDADAAARHAEVGKAMSREELAAAEAAVASWHVQPTLAEANGVSAPEGGWDGPGDGFAIAERQALVRKIQILLAEQGYDPGPADGVAGPKTVDAVRAYQRQIGQPETGEIDSTLVAALDRKRM